MWEEDPPVQLRFLKATKHGNRMTLQWRCRVGPEGEQWWSDWEDVPEVVEENDYE